MPRPSGEAGFAKPRRRQAAKNVIAIAKWGTGSACRYFFLDEDFLDEDFLDEDFLRGTLAPARRAWDNPMAIACFRLFTFLPDRPLFRVPFFRSRIAFSTFSDAFFPYFAIMTSSGSFRRSEDVDASIVPVHSPQASFLANKPLRFDSLNRSYRQSYASSVISPDFDRRFESTPTRRRRQSRETVEIRFSRWNTGR
jgi:hypothetical protein